MRRAGRQEDKKTGRQGHLRFTFYVLLIAGCWLLVAGRAVLAHGTTGTQVLMNELVGDFWVSVWLSPQVLRVGEAHVTVAVTDPPPDPNSFEAGAPVLGANVVVLVETVGGEWEKEVRVTHEAAVNKFLYEGDFLLENAGIHQFTLTINNTHTTQFTAEVLPAQLFSWWMVTVPMLVLILSIIFRQQRWQERAVKRRRQDE
jgi:hypothetical protein